MAFYRQWLLVLFALVLSGERLAAASAKEQSAYAAAVTAFQGEMWNRAETGFAQFLQKYPKSTNAPEAVLLQSQAQFKQAEFTNAIALLADPDHLARAGALADQYVYWTGEAQFQNADPANAAETFVSLARNYPASPLRLRSVVAAAVAYARLGDWRRHDALLEGTDGVFQQAARLDPGNELVVAGQLSLENSKYQQRDLSGVAAVFEQLTNQWPTLNQVQRCQGLYLHYLARMERGDFDAALAVATNLVQIAGSPTNQEWLATGWAAQAAALERMGRLTEAILVWRNNLTNAPAAQQREAILKIAELKIIQGQLTNAGQQLVDFLAQFPEAITADIARLTLGELHLKSYAAMPAETNQLQLARTNFDQFIATFTNSPLAGKAYLDRGWCGWLAGDMTNSLADFEAAQQRLPKSGDLAVARFKTGDAMFALKNYAGALENYRAVLHDFTNFPAVAVALADRALYQSLRANLRLTNYQGASEAMAQILKQSPAGDLAPASVLLYGESPADARQSAAVREQFQDFEQQFPDSPLRPQVAFAIARSYEQEQTWPAAIAGYQGWLDQFPTNALEPRIRYALARANFRAGNETNAFALFTNFVAQFPSNDLAPLAQMWVGDHYFRLGDASYLDAERNYEHVYQNPEFPKNDLAYAAQMMAGLAAMGRQDYSGAIKNYFIKLEGDPRCPPDLWLQAAFAHGNALMMDSAGTNNPLANFSLATNVFARIIQLYPTSEPGARAWGKIGECEFQLAHYDAATNAYAQVLNTNMLANVSLRSQAQVGIGLTLEKMAALTNGVDQTNLLQMALDNYLEVFDTWTGKNLGDGEKADELWVKEAGLRALPMIQLLGAGDPDEFINQMEKLFPQSKDAFEKEKSRPAAGKELIRHLTRAQDGVSFCLRFEQT